MTGIEITRSVSYWKDGNVPTLGPFVLTSPQQGLVRLDLQAPGAVWGNHEATRIVAHKWFAVAQSDENGTQVTDEVYFDSGDFGDLEQGSIYVRGEYDKRLTPLTQSEFIRRAHRSCAATARD